MIEVRILQLGNQDYSKLYQLPEYITYTYYDKLDTAELTDDKKLEKSYDMTILDKVPSDEELCVLEQVVSTYTLFVLEDIELKGQGLFLYAMKKGKRLHRENLENFLMTQARFYFGGSYGEKFRLDGMVVSENFRGDVSWNGNVDITLSGDFGKEFRQIAYTRKNVPLFKYQVIDLWLEYQKDPAIEIMLEVTQFAMGSISTVIRTWTFTEEQLKDIVQLDSGDKEGFIFVSIKAKGIGMLKLIALHDRHSRGSHGCFYPGGERFVTAQKEEVFCYFDPGNMQPPLNIFFSGYKTREGFEGIHLMKNLGCPFLLIAEARLEGGNFYIGSKEYESLLVSIIQKYMYELGFSSNQVIMSGLSMGTFGALYYCCDIKPHAVILGKPLANLGDIAKNEKHFRPGGFATSLDVLMYHNKKADQEQAEKLNERFWIKFEKSDFSQTKFIVSYMHEDDYDKNAYQMLISHLHSDGVQIYGKGIHGRHNDDTGGIVSWFVSQYKNVLWNDFQRRN